MNDRALRRLLTAAASLMFVVASASAQAGIFRAYVSINGNDSNPCTLPAPCRLLPAALAAVNDGGEIWMLDSANYNTGKVTIAKSVTILAVPGAVGSVIATGADDGILVDDPNAKVTLRNLVIVPLGFFTNGISLTSGKALVVDRCTLNGVGISISAYGSPGTADVMIKDTQISGSDSGISIDGLSGTRFRVAVTDSVIRDVKIGIYGGTGLDLTVTNTRIIGRGKGDLSSVGVYVRAYVSNSPVAAHIANSLIRNFGEGVLSQQSVAFVSASVAASELSHNAYGVYADGGTIALSGNRVLHNDVGATLANAGIVYSSGTNYFAYNVSNGVALAGPGGLQ